MAALEIVPDLPDGTVSEEKRKDIVALFKLGKRARAEKRPARKDDLNAKYERMMAELLEKHGLALWR